MYREINIDNAAVLLRPNGFLFAACCLRHSFEQQYKGMVALQAEFGKEEYGKAKNIKKLRDRAGKVRGKLDKIFADDVGKESNANVINWGDGQEGSDRPISFRLDPQNSAGDKVNLSIQAGSESIATVIFQRSDSRQCDLYRGGNDHYRFLQNIGDALLKSLERTLKTGFVVRYKIVCE